MIQVGNDLESLVDEKKVHPLTCLSEIVFEPTLKIVLDQNQGDENKWVVDENEKLFHLKFQRHGIRNILDARFFAKVDVRGKSSHLWYNYYYYSIVIIIIFAMVVVVYKASIIRNNQLSNADHIPRV